jgi:hypothetical protein
LFNCEDKLNDHIQLYRFATQCEYFYRAFTDRNNTCANPQVVSELRQLQKILQTHYRRLYIRNRRESGDQEQILF